MTDSVTTSDLFDPEILMESVKGAFIGVQVFEGTGAAVVSSTLPGGLRGGNTVTVPYFGFAAELEDVAEGVALTARGFGNSTETATVSRSGAKYQITQWAQLTKQYADPYGKASDDLVEATRRRWDKKLIDVSKADLPTSMTVDVYDADEPTYFDSDLLADGEACFGDEADAIEMIVIHPKVRTTLRKAKDANGNLLYTPAGGGKLATFMGYPLKVSERAPLVASMGDVTPAGTAPS
jgi:hypothetical protein